MTSPLEGIRILDLTRLLPGAICTMLLADMGADVIKVEDPVLGDYARWTPPMIDGLGAFFRASNRNKRSITLNLKLAEGQAVLHRLVQQAADVLIEGFRPGVTKRLGCDPALLHAINPRLITCSLSGWGQDGPYAELSGHDLNYVALSGLQASMRHPQPLGGQIADVGGAYVGVMGILAALFQRTRSDQGEHIDVSLFESALPFSMYQWVESLVAGLPGGQGSLTGGLAFYNVYLSQDGQHMALAAIESKFWENFCHAVGHPEWIAVHSLPNEQDRLRAELSALFHTRSAEDWQALLGPADCCFSLLTPPDQLTADPHIQARGTAGVAPDGVPWLRSPLRFGQQNFRLGPAPAWGEHTREILLQADYSAEEIEALSAAGAIGRQS